MSRKSPLKKRRLAPCCRVQSFFFQAGDGIRDRTVTGVQTCALPISNETIRQPDMQRKLSALGHGATKNQQADYGAPGTDGFIGRNCVRELTEIERSCCLPDPQDANKEAEVPNSIRNKRLLAGIRSRRAFKPKANQQITADAYKFPKDE